MLLYILCHIISLILYYVYICILYQLNRLCQYIISIIPIISIISIKHLILVFSCFSGVISDDEIETSNTYNPVDREDMPDGSRTPPTPPSQSPPPTSRVPAVAHIRPVSIPDIVCDMAGKDPKRKLADFDSSYMPDGVPV